MINFDCRYYRASKPCDFNKLDGSECPTCSHVSEFGDRILFVKLDAIGDVLRSASLLPNIIAKHDRPYIAWLTRPESAELVRMMEYVDEVVFLSNDGLLRGATGGWDYVYSLSNDMLSASLATSAGAKHPPVGYSIENGVIRPSNPAARHWLEMAAFDRLKRRNTRSYQDLMLGIIDCPEGPLVRPALQIPEKLLATAATRVDGLLPDVSRRRVAINLGSGGRWPKKMLDVDQIIALIAQLLEQPDVDVLLVGAAAEREKSERAAAAYAHDDRVRPALTESSIAEFVAVLAQVDTLLCGDTLALHIATAINLPTVAVFGPTSVAEIPEFDGLIAKTAVAELDCLGCYGDCTKVRHCMSLMELNGLSQMILRQLSDPRRPAGRRSAT